MKSSSNLCPRCQTAMLVPTGVGAPPGQTRWVCPACDGLPATTVGEVDFGQLGGGSLSLGELGADLGDLKDDLEAGFAPQPSLSAPPLLDDLLFGEDAGAPATPAPSKAAPTAVPGAQGLDLFLGELPAAQSSPLAGLELDLGAGGSGDLPPFATPPPVSIGTPLVAGEAAPAGNDPLDIGAMFATLLPGDPAAAAPAAPVPSPFLTPPSVPLPPEMAEKAQAQAGLMPEPGLPEPGSGPAEGSGWSLRLSSAGEPAVPRPGTGTHRVPRTPGTPPPAVPSGPSIPAGMQRLDPPRKKGETLVATVEAPPRRKLPIIAGGAGLVLVAGVLAFVFGRGGGSDDTAALLAPFAADLQKDHYPAYGKAAEALMATKDARTSASKRAAAAELLLLAAIGHGDKSKVTRANELLTDIPAASDPPPELGRAKALLAVARGRGGEIDTLLGAQAAAPEATLIKAMRRLRERRASDAVKGLRAYVAAAPDKVLGQYLLGRALEEMRALDADAAYAKVLSLSPGHAGAEVGRLRLGKYTPAERRKAAVALLDKLAGVGSVAEIGEAQTILGEALLAQGQTALALEALNKAVVATPSDPAAQAAMTEALLAEGRGGDALARLRTLDPVVLANAPGRLAMGAALVATGAVAEGAAQIEAAAVELPKDPRTLTWLAAAAENRRPPDEATAIKRYKEALEVDPRFLQASLRLAALLQRKGKAPEAIALIKEAEAAGAPSEALSVAWGQALIGAKDPAQAEVVLRKAVAASPGLVGARTGLAAALEAGGKAEEAEKELERAVSDLPKAAGLRERLAELYARNGKRERALETLEAERQAGRSSPALQVQMGKLALELGQPARAIKELEAVVNEDPATPSALFTLAKSREAARDLSGALQDYKRALAFESSPELHLAYGRALAQTGRDDEALSQLESAGEVAPARLERARIRLKRNEIEEALKEVEAATRLAPGDGRAFFMQGICLDLVGRADDAAAAWRKALAVNNDLAEAHYRLGRYEMDKGRQDSALTHFRAAASKPLDKVAWEADLYFQLGFAEAATGVRGNAMTALRRYLEISAPDAPARPEAEQKLARLSR